MTDTRGTRGPGQSGKGQETKTNNERKYAMIQTRTVDLGKFKNAVGFAATFSCKFGNSRKANIQKITMQNGDDNNAASTAEEKKAKDRMQLKKQLINSPEYDAIRSYFGEIRTWLYGRTVPSFFKEGFQLCSLDGINDIETKMKKASAEELPALVEKFIIAYPAQVEEARRVFEPVGQFNPSEYPPVEILRNAFSIEWAWVAFTVPEQLPEALRKAETEKMERRLADAGEQITMALRTGFSELVGHLTERLTSEPGEKKKTFRDTAIGNILEFIDTFSNRNLMGDAQLAELVGKAKGILSGVTPDKLRTLANVRDNTLKGFAEIQTALSGLIVERASRKFDLDDEPKADPAKAADPGELALA